ncbi:CBS domain-containing protein [Desulfovibrio oxamicus]|uniref:CBS domain-containing protein n=1 Tax=Nitratidesulfovibrio oxamicus TaxID=32016 RepID=A0ABS0J346_9BACT|nr:CBS domain-containing protein [Nitratidesulfovibrio oxamicus]MBG3876844.1 CBS domain-containing protein [Nitratidesulfovibrio oxamicus]
MSTQELDAIVAQIKSNKITSAPITPRDLIKAVGCTRRTSNCRKLVDHYLEENLVEVEPSYVDAWIDSEITIRHKQMATTKIDQDPIKKIMILEAANRKPTTISKNSTLQEAVTIMMMNDFSQLPVVSGERTVDGYVSWNTIGTALANGSTSKEIRNYINTDIKILHQDTQLLTAIKIICEHEFVVVQKNDKTLCGIITASDITSQFITITEPFLLLEQIENNVRQILNKKILLKDLKQSCSRDDNRPIDSIDDLNFGEYLRTMEDEKNWSKLNLQIDKTTFIKKLHKIREIRNDIMHFDPDGISPEQRTELQQMAQFLNSLNKINTSISAHSN